MKLILFTFPPNYVIMDYVRAGFKHNLHACILAIPKHATFIFKLFFSLRQISMSVTVTMVAVKRHASMKMEAIDAPVNLDIPKMVFITVQVIFFGWLLF